jgi:hypothetical protein
MGNSKAAWALITALLALAVLVGAAAAARLMSEVGLIEAVPAVPLALVLALVSVLLARRVRFDQQRALARMPGAGLAAVARGLGTLALIVAVTAALSLAVFAVLSLALNRGCQSCRYNPGLRVRDRQQPARSPASPGV